jgi:thiamine kinase-like enzyme
MDVSLSLCDVETECLCMHAGKIYIIDYEYGSYSYRGHDIANHFNEYAGFECDYSLYVCSSLPIFLMHICTIGFHFAFTFWMSVQCYLLYMFLYCILLHLGQAELMSCMVFAETDIVT